MLYRVRVLYSEMALACAIVLSLFWSLVHSQTFPYGTFMGQTLANHSYLDLSIKSHYDLITCCSGFGVFIVETSISPVELDCHLLVTFVRVVALKLFLKTMLSHLVVFTATMLSTEVQNPRRNSYTQTTDVPCIVSVDSPSLQYACAACQYCHKQSTLRFLLAAISLVTRRLRQ